MTWNIKQTVPTLPVPSLEAAFEFYGRLGFTKEWMWPPEAPTHGGA